MSNALTTNGGSNFSPSYASINGSSLPTPLMEILLCDDIQPGSDVSYQACKTIYAYHPLGAKMADEPINIAQSQRREISVPESPETRVKDAFNQEWDRLQIDGYIAGAMSTARIYGIGSLICGGLKENGKKIPSADPIDPFDWPKLTPYFSVMDPLNTAGSLVLTQQPNDPDFQRVKSISVAGEPYHPSRAVTLLNERPLYIEYTNASFGFVGRSVYQRALFPLKSFIRSMITNDMIATKAGLLVAKIKQAGSIADNFMSMVAGTKRALLKEAQTGNVLSVAPDEAIETLNMMNVDGAFGMARKNILEDIASAGCMPSIMLNSETFAEGFGEGSEDAKKVAGYINRVRMQMQPAYAFCDIVVMHRAWSPDFYTTIQAEYPEQYGGVDYKTAFMQWKNSFSAEWPSLLIEPESEKSKTDDVKLKAIIAMLEVLLPELDPENKAVTLQWAADNFNALKILFTTPLILDMDAVREFAEEAAKAAKDAADAALQPDAEPEEPKPEGATT